MISFRYHIVSIVAVFLALALGVVIGTTGLNGAILDDLHKQVRDLRGENNTLRADGDDLRAQVSNGNKFASAYADKILAGTLTGVPVDVIVTPGASSDVVSRIQQDIKVGGGTVAATVTVTSAWIDPASRQKLAGFVNQTSVHPVGLTLPNTTDAGILAGATLAYVLAGKGTALEQGTVLSGFANLNVAKAGADVVKPSTGVTAAKAAVVVTGGTLPKGDQRATALPSLVGQLSAFGVKPLVAGDADSATLAGLVASVRNDATLKTISSSVDNADSALGQVSTTLALAGLINGEVGHYGTAAKAENLFPSVK